MALQCRRGACKEAAYCTEGERGQILESQHPMVHRVPDDVATGGSLIESVPGFPDLTQGMKMGKKGRQTEFLALFFLNMCPLADPNEGGL